MANGIEGFPTVIPSLAVADCAGALEFYAKALDATEIMRAPGPGGAIMHAELRIGDSVLFLSDPNPERGCQGVQDMGGSPVSFYVYKDDVDAALETAVAAGATLTMPAEDMFWGDRIGAVKDPYGFTWTLATHVRDVSPDELAKAVAALQEGA